MNLTQAPVRRAGSEDGEDDGNRGNREAREEPKEPRHRDGGPPHIEATSWGHLGEGWSWWIMMGLNWDYDWIISRDYDGIEWEMH